MHAIPSPSAHGGNADAQVARSSESRHRARTRAMWDGLGTTKRMAALRSRWCGRGRLPQPTLKFGVPTRHQVWKRRPIGPAVMVLRESQNPDFVGGRKASRRNCPLASHLTWWSGCHGDSRRVLDCYGRGGRRTRPNGDVRSVGLDEGQVRSAGRMRQSCPIERSESRNPGTPDSPAPGLPRTTSRSRLRKVSD